MKRFEVHAHTEYSNVKGYDAINRINTLIDRAIELGLSGIAITEHDYLGGTIKVNQYARKIKEKYPDFKVAIGNEIYLCAERNRNQKFHHFILIAKNLKGYNALKELSTRAWLNMYETGRMERTVTTYDDLREIVEKYPNSLIATTACIGGELSSTTLNLINAEIMGDEEGVQEARNNITRFMKMCLSLFGEDFFIECAPSQYKEQIAVNKRLQSIAKAFNVPMVVGSDAHYLKKEDRYVHKAFLNSQNAEREVDAFYEYAYLQSDEECIENLAPSGLDYEQMATNSYELIYTKIEDYSLAQHPDIPSVEVKNYEKQIYNSQYPILDEMFVSDDKYDRYWINECVNALKEKNLYDDKHLSILQEEADTKQTIGKKLNTNMFKYPITLQHFVDLFWECGSTVGAGRGSACAGLNHYLLGVTQLDPIKWNLPFFRYMNKERTEIGDIDIDLCPSKRPLILNKIKEERGKKFSPKFGALEREHLGCTLIATYGTAASKQAVKIACKGYRSEEYPSGIDSDTSGYLSSLIPEERGFNWSLKEVLFGDKEKDRRPVAAFINEVLQYEGLVDIMLALEGIITNRGSHASGVLLTDENPYQHACYMRTPNGEVATQYELHDLEWAGGVKYDFLLTAVQDKITETLYMLQDYNEIDKELSLREMYNKYLHPDILNIEDVEVWKAIEEGGVIDIFQFDSPVGRQAAKKIKPQSMLELSDSNGLMRLMTAEKGEETPMDKYVRYKNNISLWYKEMDEYGLTKQEQEYVKPYFEQSYGVPPSQEQMMLMLMDEHICGFKLSEGNEARKIVGKKQMTKIPKLKEKVFERAITPNMARYIWNCGVKPQLGYSFSVIHALAYSFIGYQTTYLATHWNPIFWNTACLVVNSASLEVDDSNDLDDGEETTAAKKKSTNYGKIAKAIGDIRSRGIKVSLIDINNSQYTFKPDVGNNEILFGMKGLNKVGDEIVEKIIEGRPYTGILDFMARCPVNKQVMISLIKSGAFDKLDAEWASKFDVDVRTVIMIFYLSIVSEPKKRLTLQNFNGMLQRGLVPDSLDFEKKVYAFNKYLKNAVASNWFRLDGSDEVLQFYLKCDPNQEFLEVLNGIPCVKQKAWEKIYKKKMDTVRDWLSKNQESLLGEINFLLFKNLWDKYAKGNLSTWEMDSLCFYYHEHELANIDKTKYGIVDFDTLPEKPIVETVYKRGQHEIPLYKLSRIVGTVIGKNNTKSTVTLLTTSGVVNVKFTKEYYAMFNRQISEATEEGKKKVMEKGWFTRGSMILVTGLRREDTFVAKKYKSTYGHQLYKITKISEDGHDIEITHDRYSVEEA